MKRQPLPFEPHSWVPASTPVKEGGGARVTLGRATRSRCAEPVTAKLPTPREEYPLFPHGRSRSVCTAHAGEPSVGNAWARQARPSVLGPNGEVAYLTGEPLRGREMVGLGLVPRRSWWPAGGISSAVARGRSRKGHVYRSAHEW